MAATKGLCQLGGRNTLCSNAATFLRTALRSGAILRTRCDLSNRFPQTRVSWFPSPDLPSLARDHLFSLNPHVSVGGTAARAGFAGAASRTTAGRECVRSVLERTPPRIATAGSPIFPRGTEPDVKLARTCEMRNQVQPMRFLSTAVKGPDEKQKKATEKKSIAKRIGSLLSGLEEVPLSALGLGLAGAIPFVGLTPGIVSVLPLPESLTSIHVDAQAAYGAVILTFLGGPHWGLAMADWQGSTISKFSRQTLHTVRYVWSIIPSLVAWPALLLSPVPKLALLITSFGIVLGVDATFSRMGLLPTWYMPLRVLLTGIAMLSMTSSLIVTAATEVVTQ